MGLMYRYPILERRCSRCGLGFPISRTVPNTSLLDICCELHRYLLSIFSCLSLIDNARTHVQRTMHRFLRLFLDLILVSCLPTSFLELSNRSPSEID